MSKILVISSDCHAGAIPEQYNAHMPKKYHQAADEWWIGYAEEMIKRTGTFFDQEAVEQFASAGGDEGVGKFKGNALASVRELSEDQLRAALNDPESPFAPRPGEYNADIRLKELEDDGIAAEIVFPQMAPFGAGLMQYRNPINPEHNLAGNQAYNRWLADFCATNPGRHAGVGIVNVDDIATTVKEIHAIKEMKLFGGVLLPTSTGTQPYYHHPMYEPIWEACEKLNLPIHTHSGWSPDYGDVECATPMYISEVDMFAQRPFKALLWSGAFERHPDLKLVFTETGVGWVLEMLRVLEFKAANPLFAHFKRDLSLSPTGYFNRNCYLGASFLGAHEVGFRHEIGVEKLMWGSDYPHMEGTWPHTMASLQETFANVAEDEIRSMMGQAAANLFGFDMQLLAPIVERVGIEPGDIVAQAA